MIEILSDSNMLILEYVDEVVRSIEDSGRLLTFIGHPNKSVGMFGMLSGSSNFKMVLQDWIGSNPNPGGITRLGGKI